MEDRFVPQPGADGWQLSNPPILQLAALRGSLQVFEEAGMDRLVAKARALTQFALALLDDLASRLRSARGAARGDLLEVITPRDAAERGAQLSVRVAPRCPADGVDELDRAESLQRSLAHDFGVEVDYRRPHVLRLGFVPLYTRFQDVLILVEALEAGLSRL
jgi:kynureninase